MSRLNGNWLAQVNDVYINIDEQVLDLMTDDNKALFDNQDTLEFYLAEQVADNLEATDFYNARG